MQKIIKGKAMYKLQSKKVIGTHSGWVKVREF